MAKNSVDDWDGSTAANNSDLGGIALSNSSTTPTQIDDLFREMMKQVKAKFTAIFETGTYTPTPSPASGSFTSVGASVTYARFFGKWTIAWGTITVATLGTAGGAYTITAPFTANGNSSGGGYIASSAAGLSVVVSTGSVVLRKYDGTTPGGTCTFAFLQSNA